MIRMLRKLLSGNDEMGGGDDVGCVHIFEFESNGEYNVSGNTLVDPERDVLARTYVERGEWECVRCGETYAADPWSNHRPDENQIRDSESRRERTVLVFEPDYVLTGSAKETSGMELTTFLDDRGVEHND